MGTIFDNCSKLTSLDLSGWHTDSLEETAYMFDGCSALETLDIRNFDFSNIGSNRHDMFRDCYALREIRLNNCNKDTISKIIGINAGFPRRDSTNGTKGKIYVKRENVADLEEPQGWEFVYVN
jgi:surface protein